MAHLYQDDMLLHSTISKNPLEGRSYGDSEILWDRNIGIAMRRSYFRKIHICRSDECMNCYATECA